MSTKNIPVPVTRHGVHPTHVPVYVGEAGPCGRGVFAAVAIRRGSHVATLSGERLSYDACMERVRCGAERADDPLQIDNGMFIDLDDFSRLFNHSCDPNVGVRNVSDLYALRDIAAGEEIRYDYLSTVSATISIAEWTMHCDCRAPNCRKRIGNVLSISLDQIRVYLREGGFQAYMLRELRELGDALSRPLS